MQLLQKFIPLSFRTISFIIPSGWGDPYYKCLLWGFPCGPVAKTTSSQAGVLGVRSLVRELDPGGSNWEIPQAAMNIEDLACCKMQDLVQPKKKKKQLELSYSAKKKLINAFCNWMEASHVVDHADFRWQEVTSELWAAYEGLSPTRNLASQVIPTLHDQNSLLFWWLYS